MSKWTKKAFRKYHKENPEIYAMFVMFALQATLKREKYSAKVIMHRIRWETDIEGNGDFKIDDGWISHYARKFIEDFPQHKNFFEFRVRKGGYFT